MRPLGLVGSKDGRKLQGREKEGGRKWKRGEGLFLFRLVLFITGVGGLRLDKGVRDCIVRCV